MGLCRVATLGKIGEFNVTKEEWAWFVEQLKLFLCGKYGITAAEQKKTTFLTVITPAAFKLLRNLIVPVKSGEKDYKPLV